MAKPTPIPTAQRALATAIKALESISISTGIKGTAIKLGNEFVTDTNAVLNDLVNVKADAEALVKGLNILLNKFKQSTLPDKPVSRGLCNEIPLHAVETAVPFSGFSEVYIDGPVVDGQERCDAVTDTDGKSGSYLSQAEFEASGLKEVYDWETQDGDSVTASESVQAELNSTVPIERTAAPELFAATPSF